VNTVFPRKGGQPPSDFLWKKSEAVVEMPVRLRFPAGYL
jgi:hypothetical protein